MSYEYENQYRAFRALAEFELIEVDELPKDLQETAIHLHLLLMSFNEALEELED